MGFPSLLPSHSPSLPPLFFLFLPLSLLFHRGQQMYTMEKRVSSAKDAGHTGKLHMYKTQLPVSVGTWFLWFEKKVKNIISKTNKYKIIYLQL